MDRHRGEEELQALRERLLEVDRTASLGRMAAEVGHQILGPLSFVLSQIRCAREAVCDPLPVDRAYLRETLDEAEEGAERIARAIRELTVLASPPVE